MTGLNETYVSCMSSLESLSLFLHIIRFNTLQIKWAVVLVIYDCFIVYKGVYVGMHGLTYTYYIQGFPVVEFIVSETFLHWPYLRGFMQMKCGIGLNIGQNKNYTVPHELQ